MPQSCESSCIHLNQINVQSKGDYHFNLLESLPQQISGSFLNCFFIGSCGRKVGIPKFLLGSVWPEFQIILSRSYCCEETPVSIMFPGVMVETLELVKELLIFGRVENPDVFVLNEFFELMHTLQFSWQLQKENLEYSGLDDSYASDENSSKHETFQSVEEVKQTNVLLVGSPHIEKETSKFVSTVRNQVFENSGLLLGSGFTTSSEFCSKSCPGRCSAAVKSWDGTEKDNGKSF